MPDLMSTSLSGMMAFQRALETTGHNIANANTPGYSRQVAEFSSRLGQGTGNGYIGGGTQVTTIKRIYDEILGSQLKSSTTGYARLDVLNTLASRLDTMLADPSTGLNTGLQAFFNSVQDVANDPASLPTRQVLLGDADSLVNRFRTLDRQLDDLDAEVNQRLSTAVTEINELASAIADINDRIALAEGRTSQPPNDLLDQRDVLVRRLSEQVSVDTALQNDGTMNVYIGNGQTLVVGMESLELGLQRSEFDPTRLEVVYENVNGATPLGRALTGGAVGGLLDFREQMLDPSRQALGTTALAVTARFNEQHASGLDLRGTLGGDFFTIDAPEVLYSGRNAGSGTADAAVTDIGTLTGADYVLQYDGAAYTLSRTDTNAAVTLTGSGTPGDPFVGDGLSISVGGAPAAGDRILIRAASDVAGSIALAVSDPQAIAMAAPTRTVANGANLGTATVSQSSVVDRNDPNLLTGAAIEFTSASTYSIDGAGSFAFASGEPIVVNGSSFSISGTPSIGDRYSLEANSGASGDNRNGLLLAGVQADGILEDGNVSINEKYGQLVANVGSATRQVQVSRDAQSVILTNAEEQQMANSGVNLDEEGANLIRYQQAYQAAAQVIAVASNLFDALIGATRR